jgi:hypothetical protein
MPFSSFVFSKPSRRAKSFEMDQGLGFQRIGAFRSDPGRMVDIDRSQIPAGWLPVQAAKPGINPLPDPAVNRTGSAAVPTNRST